MKEKKQLIILVEYILLSFLSVLTLFLPYMKVTISIRTLKKMTGSASLTGWRLLKGLSYLEDVMDSEFSKYLEYFRKESLLFMIMIICFVLIPVLLMIISIIFHAISYYIKKNIPRMAIFPGVAVVLMAAGQIIMSLVIHHQVESIKKSAEEGLTSLSFFGKNITDALPVEDILSEAVQIHLRPQTGFYLFILLGVVLFVQDIIYFRRNTFQKDGGNDTGSNLQDLKLQTITTWTNSDMYAYGEKKPEPTGKKPYLAPGLDLTESSLSGMLIGTQGEYQGAKIPIRSGEWLVIGRNSDCNLILSSQKASRKHCSLTYDAVCNRYIIINYSLNGTWLAGGQTLEKGKNYQLSPGAVFRVTKDDEFKVL